jgi:hypothetical protein
LLDHHIIRRDFDVTIREWPETANWKLGTAIACVVLAGAAAIAWQVYSAKATEQELAQDARACREGADRGDAKAESRLAYLYSHGLGVPQDYGEALKWRRKAADQNYPDGENGLGYMYRYGQGVPQDYAEALRWYLKAADQGDAKGENALGLMYEEGQGVPQDYAEALRWYGKSADLGYASSEYNLGRMYHDGRGVTQNSAEAVRWYEKAASQGDEYAQRVLHWKLKGLSTSIKISLAIMFLGSSMVLVGSLMPRGRIRGEHQQALTFAAVLALSYVAFDLLGFRYIGLLTPLSAVGAFSFVKSVLGGTSVAILLRVVLPNGLWPKVSKVGLGLCGVLFVGFNLFVLTNQRMRSISPTLGSFWSLNGMLLGVMVSLAIVLWLMHGNVKFGPKLDGETAALDA